MSRVLLGVTGSVAAARVPQLHDELTRAGHEVKIVATAAALYFFDAGALGADGHSRNRDVLILDEDEWPGRNDGKRFQLGEPVVHIELRRWADSFLIAPLDANTLAKLAGGICDNCLTCVWRAWDTSRPIVLAPAMNTLMWEHPLTKRHLRLLAEDHGAGSLPQEFVVPPSGGRPPDLGLDELIAHINGTCPRLRIVAPQSKRLACGDVGVGGLAPIPEIVQATSELLQSEHSRT